VGLIYFTFDTENLVRSSTGIRNVNHVQEQTECFDFETAFGKYVSNLDFGGTMLDKNTGILKQKIIRPIKRNIMSSGNMSHFVRSSFVALMNHSIIVFQDN